MSNRNKKHGKFLPVYACKSNGNATLFGDKQMRYLAQCLRQISFYTFDLFFR